MVCAEQTIKEQKTKFDFYGEIEGHICGLLIYPTLPYGLDNLKKNLLTFDPFLSLSEIESIYTPIINTKATDDKIISLNIF